MSLPYYRFFTGDYAKDTRHLSLLQHGAYRQLIDLYMEQGGPLPNDLPRLHRLLRADSIEEKAAIEFILVEFFELSTGKKLGWIHKRCDREIEWREEKTAKATESIKKRWTIERNTNVEQTKYEGNTIKTKIYNKTNTARESPREPKIPWWETSAGIEAKGKEVGLSARPGEDWSNFKGRVFAKLQNAPRETTDSKTLDTP